MTTRTCRRRSTRHSAKPRRRAGSSTRIFATGINTIWSSRAIRAEPSGASHPSSRLSAMRGRAGTSQLASDLNELLTNVLKHAFLGREGGTITLRSVVDGDGFRIVVGDDGIGLPEGETWPRPGKLGALIAQSLTENAKARFEVDSTPGNGTRVTIVFNRSAALAT
ncbi:MAG: hypothetical protein E5W70_06370 [Mesorhizobium sp.]|nr:MAG: hypothetical protein E5W70_06370 [Mesorhizobium sp.]